MEHDLKLDPKLRRKLRTALDNAGAARNALDGTIAAITSALGNAAPPVKKTKPAVAPKPATPRTRAN